MEIRNLTEEKVYSQFGRYVWNNIKNNLDISLVRSSDSGYAIYNCGTSTGTFIPASCINLDDVKSMGWKIVGKPINPDEIIDVSANKKKKKKTSKPKKEVKKKVYPAEVIEDGIEEVEDDSLY